MVYIDSLYPLLNVTNISSLSIFQILESLRGLKASFRFAISVFRFRKTIGQAHRNRTTRRVGASCAHVCY